MGIIAVILAGIATAIWFGIIERHIREGRDDTIRHERTAKAGHMDCQEFESEAEARGGIERICTQRRGKDLERRRKGWGITAVAALGTQLEVESDVSPPVRQRNISFS